MATRTGNALLAPRVRANQPRLHDALVTLCARRAPVDRDETVDRHRHGRHEHRRVEEVFAPTPADLPPGWRGHIAAVARITRRTWLRDAASGLWAAARGGRLLRLPGPARRRELRPARARALGGIENRSHHVRDRLLREDDSRIRRKPGIFARLRSLTLNILRANGVTNISEAIYANALSLDRLLALGTE